MTNQPNSDAESIRNEAIEVLASYAALFGTQLERFGRTVLKITFSGDKDHDQWFDSNEPIAEGESTLFLDAVDPAEDSGTVFEDNAKIRIKEPESTSALVAQILTIIHPKVKAAFGTSALYPILSAAASAYGRTGETLEEKINGMSFSAASQAWIISKRIFATNHLDDMTQMLNTLLSATSPDLPQIPLESVAAEDIVEVTEYCKHIISKNNQAEAESSEDVSDPEADSPDQILREITELASTDNIVLMTAKVSRDLLEIANRKGTAVINVGKDTAPVNVKARISGRDGTPIAGLERLDYDVMEALGQIIMENGKGIIVTPGQIYRKISFSDSSGRISPQTIKDIVDSLDKLLFTPATIDLREQIEKQTKLKNRNKDIEEGKVSGAMEGNLVSGLHLKRFSAQHKGQTVEHAFLIYDIPMFYYYSKILNQLVTIPGYLLSGDAPRDKTAPKKAQDSKQTQRLTMKEIGLRRYLLEKIAYCRKLKETQIAKDRRNNTPRKEYSYQFAFETIASDLQYETDTPKRQRLLREQTYQFLQEQVEKKNIKRCEYYYKGRALSGITLFL